MANSGAASANVAANLRLAQPISVWRVPCTVSGCEVARVENKEDYDLCSRLLLQPVKLSALKDRGRSTRRRRFASVFTGR